MIVYQYIGISYHIPEKKTQAHSLKRASKAIYLPRSLNYLWDSYPKRSPTQTCFFRGCLRKI